MLEQLVRPFPSPQPFGTRRIIATSIKEPTQVTHIEWGKTGALPVPIESDPLGPDPGISFNTKKPQKEDQKIEEKSREVEKVKVQQEGNPDNFVVVERIKSMKFTNQGKEPALRGANNNGQKTTPATAPEDLSGGDPNAVPVREIGGVLQVPKSSLPPGTTAVPPGDAQAGDIYFQIKDRVYTFRPPAPGPNETVIP